MRGELGLKLHLEQKDYIFIDQKPHRLKTNGIVCIPLKPSAKVVRQDIVMVKCVDLNPRRAHRGQTVTPPA